MEPKPQLLQRFSMPPDTRVSLSRDSLSYPSNRTDRILPLCPFMWSHFFLCCAEDTDVYMMSFALLIQGVVKATLTLSSWDCSCAVLVVPWLVSHCATLACRGCTCLLVLLCDRVSFSSDPCLSLCFPLCLCHKY